MVNAQLAENLKRYLIDAENFFENRIQPSYPPYNIIADNNQEDIFIEVAIAGIPKDDLVLEQVGNKLRLSYTKSEVVDDEEVTYVYKGISSRNFELVWKLAPNIEVKGTSSENGLLEIHLKREVPEEAKPKKFKIN